MSAPSRPPRLTTACLFLGLASGLLAVSSFSGLSNLMSIDMRQSVADAMSSGPLDTTGISVDTVLDWMRWVLTAGTIVAACAVIFSIYAWRGHRPSRVIVTVWAGVAALFFLAGGLWGMLPAAFCIYCAVVLWTSDVRRWFAAGNGAPTDSDEEQSVSASQSQRESQSAGSQAAGTQSAAVQGPQAPQHRDDSPESNQRPEQQTSGQQEGIQTTESQQQAQQQAQQDDPFSRPPQTVPAEQFQHTGNVGAQAAGQDSGGPGSVTQRPQPAVAAGIITLGGAVPVLLVCGINALYAILAADSYANLLRDSAFLSDSLDSIGVSATSFVQLVAVFSSIASIASVLAIIAAICLLLHQRWSLWLLRILTMITIVFGVLGFPIGLVWAAAAVAVLILLFRPSVGRWHRA